MLLKLRFARFNILSGILIFMFLILGSCVHGGDSKNMVRFADCPDSPNCVSSLGGPGDEQHYILPYHLEVSSENAFIQIIEYLENRRDVKILEIEDGVYIHAVFISKFMRFKDDVEFQIQKDDGNGAVIDIRSASRLGYSDFGVNRTRMEEIRKYLKGIK
jgi:uncharacterized protein (DUF1499 family)